MSFKNSRQYLLIAVAGCLAWFSSPTFASDALAKKYACTACHAPDEKVLGPSFKEVAKRYAASSNASAMVAGSIQKGSTGKWGNMAMPPNPQISDDDASTLAKWVLAFK